MVKRLLSSIQHPSDKDLLLYLDGESSQRQRRRVERHLQSCWSCRAQLEGRSRGIEGLIERREEYFSASPPPTAWAGFETRLKQAERTEPERARFFRFPSLTYAGVTALALVAVLCLRLLLVAPVSASEVLKQAESAELTRIGVVSDPVIHQRFELRRHIPGQPRESAQLESWLDFKESRTHQNGGAALWKELAAIYESNHLSGRPLSARAYSSWRSSLAGASDRVEHSQLPDGSEAFEIRTTPKSAGAADTIVEAGLVVRKKDWHPVGQTLRVRSGAAVREYEVVELAYEITRLRDLDPAVFAASPAAAAALATKAPLPPPEVVRPVERREPEDEIELRALFAIHNLGACRGEPVKVGRDASGRVAVSGLVETSQRKQALIEALRDLGVKVDLVTAEEAAAKGEQETHSAGEVRVEPQQPPLYPYLRERMEDSEITHLSDRVFTLSESSMADAWALRRLAESFPERKLEVLRPSARALIERMVNDHAEAIANNAGGFLAALKPVLPAEAGQAETAAAPHASAWPQEVGRLFDLARDSQRLTQGLFLGGNRIDQEAGAAMRQLLSCTKELQARAHGLESRGSTR